MIAALVILIASAILCLLLGAWSRTAGVAGLAAVGGTLMALGAAVALDGPGGIIAWPPTLRWLGASQFSSDALSAGLGGWCLLLGALCLLKIGEGGGSASRLAVATLAVATLYSLVHTADLLAFAVQVLMLALLVWGFYLVSGEQDARTDRSALSLGLGALFILGAALIIGRTTGGVSAFSSFSLSALTVWPLALFTAFVVAWLGLIPLTGWSALTPTGGFGAMLHSLILGVPVVTLLLRLQALVTFETVGGRVPAAWESSMQALGWLGGGSALVASAGMIVWAGKSRWPALQALFWLSLTVWAVSLDTPLGRNAALVMLASYGAGRIAIELLPRSDGGRLVGLLRIFLHASLAGVPLTPGFLGIWLFGQALSGEGRPSFVLLLAGGVVLAGCGTALQVGSRNDTFSGEQPQRYAHMAGILLASALVSVTLLSPLWSSYLSTVAAVAGGTPPITGSWMGLLLDGGVLPLSLLAAGAALLGGLGWLLKGAASSGGGSSSALLPTALDRLSAKARNQPQSRPDMSALLENSPAPVWWLSLSWLDRGVWGFGTVLHRLVSRFGGLLGRLEGRFYLPFGLILTLAALLAVSR